MLIYFKEDKSYCEPLSNSHLIPPNVSLDVKQKITLKNGWKGCILARGDSTSALAGEVSRLEKKLATRRETANVSIDTISTTIHFEGQNGSQTEDGVRPSGIDELATREAQSIDVNSVSVNQSGTDNPEEADTSSSSDSDDTIQNPEESSGQIAVAVTRPGKDQLTLFRELLAVNRKIAKQQKMQVAELRKLRQAFSRSSRTPRALSDSASSSALSDTEATPVLYKDCDLTKIGERNMTPTEYGIELARKLWTDDELREGILCPKRRAPSTRQALDPNRSRLFLQACRSRFKDEVNTVSARDAANQLGCDIRRGIRKRKCLEVPDDA